MQSANFHRGCFIAFDCFHSGGKLKKTWIYDPALQIKILPKRIANDYIYIWPSSIIKWFMIHMIQMIMIYDPKMYSNVCAASHHEVNNSKVDVLI